MGYMIKIKKTKLPSDSLIREYLPADYDDSFVAITDWDIHASPTDFMVHFWTDMPGWVNTLFKLRNFLVQFVGLEGGNSRKKDEMEALLRSGGENHLMKVLVQGEKEMVIKMTDKHLDAYLSVLKEGNQTVYTNTLVQFHNRLGRVYFFVIGPFHNLVVRGTVKRTIKKFMPK